MTPPFHITGAAGRPLDAAGRPFRPLAGSAALTLRSLGPDTLTYRQRAAGTMPVPATDQPLALADDTGATVFSGFVTARRWIHSARAWQITATGPYQALAETDLLDADGRPYVSYPAQDWRLTVADVFFRAAAAGVPIQIPPSLPAAHAMPKMAFKSAKLAEALERLAALVPDLATRMDYGTTPPTLRFFTREETPAVLLDLEAPGHGVDEPDLEEIPADRALAVSFAYARRDGDSVVQNLIQTAGDDAAEARRKVSVFLSGPERLDMFVSESLATARQAQASANAALEELELTVSDATAGIAITWANILARDTNLQAAVAAQAGFSMTPASFGVTLYTGIGCGAGAPWEYTASMSKTGPALYTSGGSLATGWHAIVTGTFTPDQLATAGATKETRYIRGWLYRENTRSGSGPGFATLPAGLRQTVVGYSQNYTPNCATTSNFYRQYGWYYCDIAVDAINMAPSAVAAAVNAAAGSGSTALIERAEFVEAPDGLAAFWFARQDWAHFRGSFKVMPRRRHLPLPGDFISIAGDFTPEEWAAMRNPVAECEIDLADGRATVRIGPPARLDVGGILDRLWVPPGDNYEAG